jgi:hypothetical protein
MPQGAKRSRVQVVDTYRRELAVRVFQAFKSFNADKSRAQEISQTQLGEIVAKRLGLKEPIPQPTVSRWMSETNPMTPDNPTLDVIASVLRCNREWLVFGAVKE